MSVPPDDPAAPSRATAETVAFVMGLRARGVRDTALLSAMELISRERFAPRRLADLARVDIALPLPCGQTMTAPSTVAAMLLALEVLPGQRVLEVGTGSGYVTALLAHLGARVVTVERCATLAASARLHLEAAGALGAVSALTGDGLGGGVEGPFDRVLLNGTVPAVPEAVRALVAPGGRLVAGSPGRPGPRLHILDRLAEGWREGGGAALRLAPLTRGRAAAL